MNFLPLTLLFLLASTANSWAQGQKQPPKILRLMSFNAENLFDHKHDEGTQDYEYLPLNEKQSTYKNETAAFCRNNFCLNKNWTKEIALAKANKIAQAIAQAKPDIVLLQEVENQAILNLVVLELNRLTKTTYYGSRPVAQKMELRDPRGIGQAIISKFKFQSEVVDVDLKLTKETDPTQPDHYELSSIPVLAKDLNLFAKSLKRGVQKTTILLPNTNPGENQKSLILFNVHWPSQGNPGIDRIIASAKLKKLVENELEKKLAPTQQRIIMAAGDFNTRLDERYPTASSLQAINPTGHLESITTVSNYTAPNKGGRYFKFVDIGAMARKSSKVANQLFFGTYNYKGDWGPLDRLFVVQEASQKEALEATSAKNINFCSTAVGATVNSKNNFCIDINSFRIQCSKNALHYKQKWSEQLPLLTTFINKKPGDVFVNDLKANSFCNEDNLLLKPAQQFSAAEKQEVKPNKFFDDRNIFATATPTVFDQEDLEVLLNGYSDHLAEYINLSY